MNLVRRNLVWLLISQLATWMVTLVFLLVVPRYLGSDGFGTYNFVVAYMTFFGLFGSLGTSILMTREVARDYSIVAPYVVNGIAFKTVVATVLSGVAILGAIVFGFDRTTFTLVLIGCGALYLLLYHEVFTSALNGMQRMGKSSAWQVLSIYVASIGGIVVLARGGGIVSYALVAAAATVIPVVGNGILLWPIVRGHRHLDLGIWRHLAVAGAPLMLLTLFNQVYNTVDVPILKAISGASAVGFYALAYRWAGIPVFIVNAVVASHYPEFSIHGKTGGPAFADSVNRALKLVLLVTVPAAVGMAVIAPDLMTLLYRGEFDGSTRPLQILALQIPIMSLDTVLATALIAADRMRRYLWVAGAAAVLNPPLCIVFIGYADRTWGNGAIGAAIMTALTEVFVMTCALMLRSRGVMDRALLVWTGRCVLASASIALVGILAGGTHVAVQVVLGITAFGIAGWALHVIERDLLRTVLARVRSARSRDEPAPVSEGAE